MNNLPKDFSGLLTLLKQFVDDNTDQEFNQVDVEGIGENVIGMLEQYDILLEDGPK